MERARPAGFLCPDGRHSVRATHTAGEGLRAVSPELLAHISRMLCEIAEVAELSPMTGIWDDTSLLRLHAGHVLVLYSLDGKANIVFMDAHVEGRSLKQTNGIVMEFKK